MIVHDGFKNVSWFELKNMIVPFGAMKNGTQSTQSMIVH